MNLEIHSRPKQKKDEEDVPTEQGDQEGKELSFYL